MKAYYRAAFYLPNRNNFAQWTTKSDAPNWDELGTGYFLSNEFGVVTQIGWDALDAPKKDIFEYITLEDFKLIVLQQYKDVVGYYIGHHIKKIPIKVELDHVPPSTRDKKVILNTYDLYVT